MARRRIAPATSIAFLSRSGWHRIPSDCARSMSFPAGSQISSARCPIRRSSRVSPSTWVSPPAKPRSGSIPAIRSGRSSAASTVAAGGRLCAFASIIGGASIPKAVVEDGEGGGDRIAPSDLLPFFVCAAGVGNRNFVDAPFGARGLGGYLRLEGETVGGELEPHQLLPHKRFHSGFHVGQIQIAHHIGKQRDEPVADVVPEEQHAMRSAEKARSVNHVGATVEKRLDHLVIVARVVL